jgi:hypothetical protein
VIYFQYVIKNCLRAVESPLIKKAGRKKQAEDVSPSARLWFPGITHLFVTGCGSRQKASGQALHQRGVFFKIKKSFMTGSG